MNALRVLGSQPQRPDTQNGRPSRRFAAHLRPTAQAQPAAYTPLAIEDPPGEGRSPLLRVPEHAVSTSSPLFPLVWSLKSAPVADAAERLVLVALAETALSDGTRACRSRAEIAAIALVDEKTVQRRTSALLKRGLIIAGDQQAVEHLPAGSRPKVYDIQIPYTAFPAIEQVNAERDQRGEPALTPEIRPELGEAPEKQRRKDAGMILGPQRQRTGISDALRKFVYERDGYLCVRCGTTEDLTLDHIHPWVLGGTNSVENLQTLCRSCNSSKNATVEGPEVTS